MPDHGLPEPSAALALILVWIEAECAGLTPKQRVSRLRRADAIFERMERKAGAVPMHEPKRAAALTAARREAHAAFKEWLPRLLGP